MSPFRLGLGLGTRINTPGAGGGVAPLRTVSPHNRISASLLAANNSSGSEDIIFSCKHAIGGGDVSEIILEINNYSLGTSSTYGVSIPACGMLFKELYVTLSNGTYVQATYNGATTFTIAAGDYVRLDAIPASAFSLSVLPQNQLLSVKGRWEPVDSNGDPSVNGQVSCINGPLPVAFSTVPSAKIARDTYPSSQLRAYGGLTAYAGWGSGGRIPPIFVLGRFVGAEPPTYMIAGDSIGSGTADTVVTGSPIGFFGRSMLDSYASPTTYRAGINLGIPSGEASVFSDAAPNNANGVLEYISRYCTVLFDQYGTNSLVYPAQSNAKKHIIDTFLAAARGGAKTPQVITCMILPKTTGTFTSSAGQSLAFSVGVGSSAESINDAMVAYGSVDHVLSANTLRESTDDTTSDYWKWVSTGSISRTVDGTHPCRIRTICGRRGETAADFNRSGLVITTSSVRIVRQHPDP